MQPRRLTGTLLGLVFFSSVLQGRAEDQTQPTIQTLIGGFFFDPDLSYVAESQVRLPVLRSEPLSIFYWQREVTPVLKEGSQTELFTSRNSFEADFTLGDQVRLITIGGYHRTGFEDRAGALSAYEIGGGIGSPLGAELPRLEWSAVAGGYVSGYRLDANWWADLHAAWRAFEFPEGQVLETSFRPWLGLAADLESANDGARFHGLYKIGPVLEMLSANGNRVRFQARWQANDSNPFFERRYSALLLGVEVNASLDQDVLFDARERRPLGWLPLIWGQYDVGYGVDRSMQRTELNAEIHDLIVAGHPITAVLWYESRQEMRPGDYDNVSYSISFGAQTRIGLSSLLSQGQPLVLGAEYVHRSAHALAPDASRVPPPSVLPHDSINLTRVRLQTLGWDAPYRDPTIYQAKTEWLNHFDWRVTLGHDFHHSRERSNPAAQLGLNWDAATIQGCVVYARGLGSVGNETPDWLGEIGVRRRAWRVFFRYERYGLESDLARGDTAVVGVGFHL
jgi:hypothetical protein